MIRAAGAAAITAVVLALAGPAAPAAASAGPVVIAGTDLHDGSLLHEGSTWYAYGTQYGCGFRWRDASSTWCGFGVSTAPAPGGPWGKPRLLFGPGAVIANTGWQGDAGKTWQNVCAYYGCFNPHMVRRPDGRWLLWFDAPRDKIVGGRPAYWVMTCASATGPCGSPHKPVLSQCNQTGDFTIASDGAQAVIVCSTNTLDEETLTANWEDGTGAGATGLAGGVGAEGPGVWQEPGGTWMLTFSTPRCGYCSGVSSVSGVTRVRTGYATARALTGPWTDRGYLDPAWCTGQPRTIGAGYEWIDWWLGTPGETAAKVALEPMTAAPWSCHWVPGTAPPGTRGSGTAAPPAPPTGRAGTPSLSRRSPWYPRRPSPVRHRAR